MRIMIPALFFVSVLTASASQKMDCNDTKNYPAISKAELQVLVEKEKKNPHTVAIIDVNDVEVFKEKGVTGAQNFYELEKQKTFAQALPKDRNGVVVAYCGGPTCGAWKKAAKAACAQGYTNIRHYPGGIQEWAKNKNL